MNRGGSLKTLAQIFRVLRLYSAILNHARYVLSYYSRLGVFLTYHMQGKITECWLAGTEGIFFLIKRALLVIKRAWLLDADWPSTPALNWFPASNGVWKGISETHRFWVWILTRSIHLNVKENQHATKRSLLVEKQKDFSDQKRIDSQRENSLSGDGWCRTKH